MADEDETKDVPVEGNKRKRTKKKKKSFLSNARKYGKKGCYGRGSQLDAETYQYFVRILEVYKEGFPTDEVKRMFVNNVFEQMENKEVTCCCNQIGCRVIELLMPFANAMVLERFMKVLGEDIRPLCSDRFASHVMETLLSTCCKLSKASDQDDEFRMKCKLFTIKLSKFLLNNMEDYVWDTYGNHIIRKVMICLAEVTVKPNVNEKKQEEDVKGTESNNLPEYVEIVKEYAERLISWPQFKDMPYQELTSGLLQVILQALKAIDDEDLLNSYFKKLLNDSFIPTKEDDDDSSKMPDVFMSKPAMMILETYLEVTNIKYYNKIYKKCFANDLVRLAKTRATNFAVQKLIANCTDKAIFETIYDEIDSDLKAIAIDGGHTGVVLALGQACHRLSAKQGNFVRALMKALDVLEPADRHNRFAVCLATFSTYDQLATIDLQKLDTIKLNLHGTLLIQAILNFNKPIKMIDSLLSLETNELKGLISNAMGSHIVDTYMTSAHVGEKSRERFCKKLQGTYRDLASTKYGSRCFDAIWAVSNAKTRASIAGELAHKEASWSHGSFGKIIAAKINLSLFKRDKTAWCESASSKKDKLKSMMDMF